MVDTFCAMVAKTVLLDVFYLSVFISLSLATNRTYTLPTVLCSRHHYPFLALLVRGWVAQSIGHLLSRLGPKAELQDIVIDLPTLTIHHLRLGMIPNTNVPSPADTDFG
jgi:hypothetical protein